MNWRGRITAFGEGSIGLAQNHGPHENRKGLFLDRERAGQQQEKLWAVEKVEIQNQDFHFFTAQNRLRRKEMNYRLHKTLDAPE